MKIIKNYILYLIYQITLMLLPFVTIPYITRVLGSTGVGAYAFIDSVAQIFILIGTLGIGLYGNREIAYAGNDIEKRSKVFWEIFLFRTITLAITIISYLIFVIFFVKQYKFVYLIFTMLIINYGVTITWLFAGMEDFKKWVSRSFIVKIIAVILIFCFVKTADDLWKYAMIYSSTELISAIILWVYAPRYIKFVKVTIKDILKHFYPVCALFIPQIAISIYFIMDKTILGILSSISEVGYYDMAMKIVKVSVTLVTSLSYVIQPRISKIFAEGDFEQIKYYTNKTFDFASFLAIPLSVGILSIAPEFVPWFFGSGFLKVAPLLQITGFLALPMAWASVIGAQLMVAMNKEKLYSYSVIFAAVSNVVLNFLLIPYWHSVGACIAMLAAQIVLVIVQMYLFKDFLQFNKMFKDIWKYLAASFVFFIIIRIIGANMGVSYNTTIIQIAAGTLSYPIILYLLKSEMNAFIFNKLYVGYKKVFGKDAEIKEAV